MLKERLIAAIEARPAMLNMTQPMSVIRWNHIKYNFPALILKESGYSLQDGDSEPRLPLNAPLLDKKWFEYEFGHEIPALARQLWEQDYGEKEAQELPFYDRPTREGARWWDDLSEVSYRHLLAYLRGNFDIYNLKGPNKPGD